MPATKARRVEFTEIKCGTASVFFAQAHLNHQESMETLSKNGLRPLTYQETFDYISKSPVLRAILEGKILWIEGDGSEIAHLSNGKDQFMLLKFDGNGELSHMSNGDYRDVPSANIVYAHFGPGPLSVGVHNGESDFMRAKYNLSATIPPSAYAAFVVGVRDEALAAAKRK